jgi:predicted ABC-type sugar transport system permease subunit
LAGTQAAATATVGAAYTQAAAAQLTVLPTTTALAAGGIADEYGLPGLVVMALAFVIVILFARRLRTSPGTNR